MNLESVVKTAGVVVAVMFVHEVLAANGIVDIRALAAKVKLPAMGSAGGAQ